MKTGPPTRKEEWFPPTDTNLERFGPEPVMEEAAREERLRKAAKIRLEKSKEKAR